MTSSRLLSSGPAGPKAPAVRGAPSAVGRGAAGSPLIGVHGVVHHVRRQIVERRVADGVRSARHDVGDRRADARPRLGPWCAAHHDVALHDHTVGGGGLGDGGGVAADERRPARIRRPAGRGRGYGFLRPLRFDRAGGATGRGVYGRGGRRRRWRGNIDDRYRNRRRRRRFGRHHDRYRARHWHVQGHATGLEEGHDALVEGAARHLLDDQSVLGLHQRPDLVVGRHRLVLDLARDEDGALVEAIGHPWWPSSRPVAALDVPVPGAVPIVAAPEPPASAAVPVPVVDVPAPAPARAAPRRTPARAIESQRPQKSVAPPRDRPVVRCRTGRRSSAATPPPSSKTASADGVVVQRNVVVGGTPGPEARPRIRPPVPYRMTRAERTPSATRRSTIRRRTCGSNTVHANQGPPAAPLPTRKGRRERRGRLGPAGPDDEPGRSHPQRSSQKTATDLSRWRAGARPAGAGAASGRPRARWVSLIGVRPRCRPWRRPPAGGRAAGAGTRGAGRAAAEADDVILCPFPEGRRIRPAASWSGSRVAPATRRAWPASTTPSPTRRWW